MCIVMEKTKIQIEAAHDLSQVTNILTEIKPLQEE